MDGQTLKDFDKDRDRNLYKLWNRLCSGSYFPPAVREKRIPKDNGKERILGIPTVSDRIAQGAVKLFMEERLDPLFHNDSYGYRPNKSAHQAVQQCMERCWRNSWVLEVDISAFFDTVRHDLVIKALEHHQMPRWVILYCTRWMEAPMQSTARPTQLDKRVVGTPQGGTTWSGYGGSVARVGSGIFAGAGGALGGALGASAYLGGALFGTYVVNPGISWASTNLWGGSGSLGSDIYDWTH